MFEATVNLRFINNKRYTM